MENRPLPGSDENAPRIADAASLFEEETVTLPPSSKTQKTTNEAPSGELYEVEGSPQGSEGASGEIPIPVQSAAPEPESKSRKPKEERPTRDPEDAVDIVWSRGAEWGGSIAVLAVVGMGLLLMLYMMVEMEMYLFAFFVLVLGAGILLLLSYPILITLERPVRVTPEQAARDYFNALSHHMPHYKRMWLLLSTHGHVSNEFDTFEGFKSYWKSRLSSIRSGKAPGWTPLKFVVEDFKSEKSAGKFEVDGSFTVKVMIRGRQQEGPIDSIRVSTSFVKGPDRMWYLEKGSLPQK